MEGVEAVNPDAMRRFWRELMAVTPDDPSAPFASPRWPAVCPVCLGWGRLTSVNRDSGGSTNAACDACDGSGKVMLCVERRGIA